MGLWDLGVLAWLTEELHSSCWLQLDSTRCGRGA